MITHKARLRPMFTLRSCLPEEVGASDVGRIECRPRRSPSGAPAIPVARRHEPVTVRRRRGNGRTAGLYLAQKCLAGKLPRQRRTKQILYLDRHNSKKIIIYSTHTRKYPGPVTL